MAEKWTSVTVECWNYRFHSVGHTKVVEINDKRFCDSDCDAENCPLHKSKGLKP